MFRSARDIYVGKLENQVAIRHDGSLRVNKSMSHPLSWFLKKEIKNDEGARL